MKAQTAAEDDAAPAIKKNSRPEDEIQITAIEKTEETVKQMRDRRQRAKLNQFILRIFKAGVYSFKN
jgi:hypothetical protein